MQFIASGAVTLGLFMLLSKVESYPQQIVDYVILFHVIILMFRRP